MEIPLELSTRQIDLPPVLEQEIRDRAQKLERFYNRLTSCRIAVEGPGNRHQTGGPYRVRLDITVPGSELVASKEGETLNVAVQAAFQAAERQVEEYARLRRGEVKSPPEEGPAEGRVVRIFPDEGFGFLTGQDGSEVYFHRNAVLSPGFESLAVGAAVRYAMEQGNEGPQASTVTPA
ncbi:MAG TPA: HPF/RaiA family ribosome-associated protein [Thermoanaerobaculia bacterium]|nr:HPF/RaiA family ribosome-associated protein [Thermoanaerobaculia bacterium]